LVKLHIGLLGDLLRHQFRNAPYGGGCARLGDAFGHRLAKCFDVAIAGIIKD